MLDVLTEVASWILLLSGGFFLVVGGIGLNRMPDVFTRLHATSVSDSAGAGLLLIGLMLQAGWSLVSIKLLFILAIFFFTTPVATHAVTRAALAFGVEPLQTAPDGTLKHGRAAAKLPKSERWPEKKRGAAAAKKARAKGRKGLSKR